MGSVNKINYQTSVNSENSENLAEIDEEMNFKNFDGKLDNYFISETIQTPAAHEYIDDIFKIHHNFEQDILTKNQEKTRMPLMSLQKISELQEEYNDRETY
jgi:hypothetical protein